MLVVVCLLGAVTALAVVQLSGVTDRAGTDVAVSTLQAVRESILGSDGAPGYLDDMKHVPGFRPAGLRIHDLLDGSSHPGYAAYDPQAARGWRGPYLRNAAGVRNTCPESQGLFPAAGDQRWTDDATFLERGFFIDAGSNCYARPGDRAAADPWGNPVVLQLPDPGSFPAAVSDSVRFRYARIVSAGPDGMLQTPRTRLAGLMPDGSRTARGDDLVLFLNRADVYEPEEP